MNLLHDLLEFSDSDKNKPIIKTKYEVVSRWELSTRVSRTILFLRKYNLSKGDRVLILLPNCIETIQLLFALSKLGAIAVVIDPTVKKRNLEFIINDCKPKLLLVDDTEKDYSNDFGDIIQKKSYNYSMKNKKLNVIKENECSTENISNEEDPVLFIYTSGSTGNPKAVIAAHKQIIFCVKSISKSLGINNKDIIGNFLPLSFDYGLYQVFIALYCSATVCIGNSNEAGIQLFKYLDDWKVTILPSMPHLTKGLMRLIKRYKENLQIRMITNTGERLSKNLIYEIQSIIPDCKIFSMYGLTECKRVSILDSKEINQKIESVGKPLKGTNCYVIDNECNILGPNEIGELIVTGPHLMKGYWNCKELTYRKYKKVPVLNKIALFTGDLFRIDIEGYLYFEGRKDDLYKQKGFRISAVEIEEVVESLIGIEKAVLLPPDNDVEKSFLFVVGDVEISAIKEYIRENLEAYKMPTHIIKIKKMPINSNGKIDKLKLKLDRESYI
ncbi:AMP-dependent synthetase [Bacillus cereus]|uniref:class I adenylate-forming enzyme family protein n=1 Tax=Bacillus cereus TaxID=1396 RepID=UPI000BF69231|nr:AMP-binding protein [Bacillus cereus]PFX72059.1 AMP-dependent synthetase [Bacillus cereus]